MSRRIRKLKICMCGNKGAGQLCSNCTADPRLCFRYTDSTIHLLKSEISSIKPSERILSDLLVTTSCWFSHTVVHEPEDTRARETHTAVAISMCFIIIIFLSRNSFVRFSSVYYLIVRRKIWWFNGSQRKMFFLFLLLFFFSLVCLLDC